MSDNITAAVVPLQNPDLFSGYAMSSSDRRLRGRVPCGDMFTSLVSSYEIIYLPGPARRLHPNVLDNGGIGCRIAIFQERALCCGLVVEVIYNGWLSYMLRCLLQLTAGCPLRLA